MWISDGVLGISTHAPLAGRDGSYEGHAPVSKKFQPTRPLRGATAAFVEFLRYSGDFNPRAPCGARQGCKVFETLSLGISTHAPLAGRDQLVLPETTLVRLFQPTRPLRGATPGRGY